jgi:hypothetical protein
VIQGLISGIGSMIGSVGSAIGNIASEITSHLPFSPAKKGPLSGSGSPDKAGQKITAMIASGMLDNRGLVLAASAKVAGAAAISAAAGRASAAGAGDGVLRLEWVGGGGDSEIFTYLKKHIRIRGGNPAVLGR